MIIARCARPFSQRLHRHHVLPSFFPRRLLSMATNLPSLEPHTRLSPRVIRIFGGNPGKYTLQGTNTYLIGTGDVRMLIDTGEGRAAWRSTLEEVLKAEKCSVGNVLLTHWHPDHVGGVGDVLALEPAASVHKFGGNEGGPSTASSAAAMAAAGTPQVSIPASVAAIRDREEFAVHGATLRAVHAPGHTSDHVGFVLREEGDALFSGDAVLGHGTAVFEDLATYVRGLGLLKDACGAEARIYPAHGAVVDHGRAKIQEYIDHRAQREVEILNVLRQTTAPCSPMDIVQVVYKDYPKELHAPAEGGVRLVLAKLETDGSATEDGGKWRAKDGPAL